MRRRHRCLPQPDLSLNGIFDVEELVEVGNLSLKLLYLALQLLDCGCQLPVLRGLMSGRRDIAA